MSKFKPLGDRVIVERIEEATQTRGGLFIPDNARERPQRGVVIAAGDAVVDEGLLPGVEVLFGKYAGTEVANLDDREKVYLILTEDDVLAIVE